MAKKLKVNKKFIPCPTTGGDEIYPNGFFKFNITEMLEYIKENNSKIIPEEILVSDYPSFSSLDESYVDTVDVSKPVIIAEIAPDRYNVIDGNHRMAKARKTGIKKLQAYKLKMRQHINFLISKEAYESYVEYWNSKL